MVGFHVTHPGIFRPLFFFQREVQQQIETGKVQVAFDDSLRLLTMQPIEFLNGSKELIQEPHFFFAKANYRNMSEIFPFASWIAYVI